MDPMQAMSWNYMIDIYKTPPTLTQRHAPCSIAGHRKKKHHQRNRSSKRARQCKCRVSSPPQNWLMLFANVVILAPLGIFDVTSSKNLAIAFLPTIGA